MSDATAGLRELRRMLTALAPAPNFGDDAACLGYENPDAFFPDEEEPDEDATAAALALCQACPVRAACLEYATRNGLREGIWGGALPQDRGEGSYSNGKCENGHVQDSENSYINARGKRICRACRRERLRRYRARCAAEGRKAA